MKDAFKTYFPLKGNEFAAMWKECLFSFDASVLLNVYGYSKETREELLSLLERLSARARLPHQFGLEFVRNRVKVILKQISNYHNVERDLVRIKTVNFAPRREHPFLSAESLKSYEQLCVELASDRQEMEELINTDPYAERISNIFDGRVGPAPSEEKIREIHAEAKRRYDKKIPPGYEDLKEKGEPAAFGDYTGWIQLIELAKVEDSGIIFVCDDTKEDWWHIEKERTVGPRYELTAEFTKAVEKPFYMYSSDSFLRYAKEYLDEKIAEGAIIEISERLASQTETQRAVSLKPAIEPSSLTPESLKPATAPSDAVEPNRKPSLTSNSSDLKPQSGGSENAS